MGKTLYLECEAGISGDMSVATLIDLGADVDVLNEVLKSLPLDGYNTEISRVVKSGLDCCDFNVVLEHDNKDHDMEYLHGHSHEHHHGHNHDHEHGHSHAHSHRHLKDIYEIIDAGEMTDGARALAKKIFAIIGDAEAKAHGVPVEEVGFHEVGAVDSIVDIVAFAVCYDNLGITETIIPKLNEGKGTVRCQHGILPVPVPAVTNILTGTSMPIEIMDIKGEFITPTGAAIAVAIATSHKLPKAMRITKVGIGAGKRNYERASLVRGLFIEEA